MGANLVSDPTRLKLEKLIRDSRGTSLPLADKDKRDLRLRVTSSTVTSYGYPAIRIVWDNANEEYVDLDAVTVYVASPNGNTFTSGDKVRAVFRGVHPGGGGQLLYEAVEVPVDIPDCSLSVPGKINLVNQKLGAGTKVVSALGLGTDYADLVEIAAMSYSTFHSAHPHVAASLFTPDASELLGYTTDGCGVGAESIYVKSSSNPGNRMWWLSANSGSVDISGTPTAYASYSLSPLLSYTPGVISATDGGYTVTVPGLAGAYTVGAAHGGLTSSMVVSGLITGTEGVQSCSRYFVNDQGNLSGEGAATMFAGGFTPVFTQWYGVTVRGGIVTSGSTTVPTSALSGSISVANGGTGASSFSSGKLLYGNGTGAVQAAANVAINGSGQLELTTAGRTISFTSASF